MIVHICLNLERLSPVCEEVFLNFQREAFGVELVETVSKFSVEHLFAVLLQEIEVFILSRQEDRSIDLK